MSTITSQAASHGPHRLERTPPAAVPFRRLMRVELRKAVDTRSGRWLLVGIAALSTLIMVATWLTEERARLTADVLLSAVSVPQSLLLPLVGILCVTSEFSQRTTLTTFALEPRRGRVLAAKVGAVLSLGAILAALALAVAVAGAALAAWVHGTPGVWDLGPGKTAGILGVQAVLLLWGLAFGLVFLNSPAAIVTYLVLPVAWTILLQLVQGLRQVQPWLDLNTATNPLVAGSMTATDWAHLGTAMAVWIALPTAIGWWRVQARELR